MGRPCWGTGGVELGYGTRDTHNEFDAVVHTYGREKQVEVRFDHTTIASLATGVVPSSKVFTIPVGAKYLSSDLTILETFIGSTNIIVGTKLAADGLTVDDNGLHTVEIDAVLLVGATFENNGALVDADVTTTEQVISVDTTAAPTAGEAVLNVRYLEPLPSSTPPVPQQGIVGSL